MSSPESSAADKKAFLQRLAGLMNQWRKGQNGLLFIRVPDKGMLDAVGTELLTACAKVGPQKAKLTAAGNVEELKALLGQGRDHVWLVDAAYVSEVPRSEKIPQWDALPLSEPGPLLVVLVSPSAIPKIAANSPKAWGEKLGYLAWPDSGPPSDIKPTQTAGTVAPALKTELDKAEFTDMKQILGKLQDKESAVYLLETAKNRMSYGDLENARLMSLRAADIFKATSDLPHLTKTYEVLGQLAFARGDADAAVDWLNHAIEGWRLFGTKSDLSDALSFVGFMLFQRQRIDLALKYFKEAMEIDEALGDKARLSKGFRQFGMVLEASGKLDRARLLYEKSRKIEEELNNQEGLSRIYHHLGRLAELEGDYETAEHQFKKALEIKRTTSEDGSTAATLHQLGNLVSRRGDYVGAEAYYAEALQLEKRARDLEGYARTMAQFGLVTLGLGKPEKALSMMVEAYNLVERQNPALSRELKERIEQLRDRIPVETFNKIVREKKEQDKVTHEPKPPN